MSKFSSLTVSMCLLLLTFQSDATLLGSQNLTVEGSFQFCDLNNMKIFSQNIDCKSLAMQYKYTDQHREWAELYYVLHQRAHPIDGMTVFCEVSDISITWTDHFFWKADMERSETFIKISGEACRDMAESLTCFGQPMTCLDNVCEHKVEPKPDKRLWQSDTKTTRRCTFHKHRKTADLPDETIAIGIAGPCLAKDQTCVMPTGVLTWLHKDDASCPYETVMWAYFRRHNDILTSVPNNEDWGRWWYKDHPLSYNMHQGAVIKHYDRIIPYSETQRPVLLLQIKSQSITTCSPEATKVLTKPIELWTTTQGLLVTKDIRAKQFPVAKQSDSLDRQIQLADGDLHIHKEHEERIEDDERNWAMHCRQIQLNMQLFLTHENKFFRLAFDQDEIFVYADNGMLYLPKCELVSSLTFFDRLENCYEDVPIRLANQAVAFLKQGQFIVNKSRLVSCENVNSQINVADKVVVNVKGNRITLQPLAPRQLYVFKPLQLKHEKFDYDHDPLLTANFDLLGEQERTESVFDKGQTFQISDDLRPTKNNHTLYEFAGHVFSSFQDFRHKVFIICILLLLVFPLLALVAFFLIKYFAKNGCKKPKHMSVIDIDDTVHFMPDQEQVSFQQRADPNYQPRFYSD